MKRLDFLKKLGIRAAAVVVAPSTFIKAENTQFITKESLQETAKPVEELFQASEDYDLTTLDYEGWSIKT